MMGDMYELSMGKMRDGIKLHTTGPYHPASSGVAERMIGVLINVARTGHGRVQVGYLVQSISPIRAIAKGKIQSRMKTYKWHQITRL